MTTILLFSIFSGIFGILIGYKWSNSNIEKSNLNKLKFSRRGLYKKSYNLNKSGYEIGEILVTYEVGEVESTNSLSKI